MLANSTTRFDMSAPKIPMSRETTSIPTHGVAEFVRQMAERHGVKYVETAADRIAHVVTQLAGDDIEVDEIEDLVVALWRHGAITKAQSLELIGTHVLERRTINER